MANMTKDTSNNIWPYSININGAGTVLHTFATQNKFIDANIVATITTPARGTLSLNLDNNTDTVLTVGTLSNNKYPFTANLGGTVSAASAGWITNSAESVSANNVTVGYLNKAGFTVNGNAFVCNSPGYIASGSTVLESITQVTPTASINTGTNNNYNGLTTYFDKLTNATGASITIKPQYSTSAGYVASATNSVTDNNITYWAIKTVSPTFSAAPGGNSTATFSNITTSDTNNGISILTKYSINATTISYAAAATGWINKTGNSSTGSSTTPTSSTNGNIYYVTGIEVPKTKSFTLTTTANSSTDTSIITIINNDKRNIEITNSGNVYARLTSSGKGNVYVRPYDSLTDTQIINNGLMLTSTITIPTWTKNSTSKVATMGDFTYTDGYISTGDLDAATFHNTPTENTTYLDLSDALVTANGSYVVPEIGTDGYLYINQGYIDNIKISLARLIPGAEDQTHPITSALILLGYEAYDKDGHLLTGNILTKTQSNLSFDTSTGVFTTPAGYYASLATKEIGIASITVDSCTFSGSGDTDLDNYLSATGTTSGDVSIRPRYKNTEGYIAAHSSYLNGTIIYYNLKSPTFESNGGSSELAADTTNTTTARSIYTTTTDTFISIGSSAPALNNTGKVYIKINSSDTIRTTSSGRGAIKSGVTITTPGTHTSYIGIDLYNGEYSTAAVTT